MVSEWAYFYTGFYSVWKRNLIHGNIGEVKPYNIIIIVFSFNVLLGMDNSKVKVVSCCADNQLDSI